MGWREKYGNWEGTAEELASLADTLEKRLFPGLPEDSISPNVRLIRGYVTDGVVSRAERRSREAIFGFKQLLELLVARVLLREGWPLSKVALLVRTAPEDQLIAILPAPEPTKAQQLVAAFGSPAVNKGPRPDLNARPRRSSVMVAAKLSSDLVSLGNFSGAPNVKRTVTVDVAPWCHVTVDVDALQQLDDLALERVADAIRASLAKAKLM